MSQENLELVRRMQEAYLGSEPEQALAFFDPDVEWDVSDRPGGKVWHGRDGVRRAMAEWAGAWEDRELETEEYREAGEDKVLILWRERGRGKRSGASSELRGGNLMTVRDGRIVHGRVFVDRRAALEATRLAR